MRSNYARRHYAWPIAVATGIMVSGRIRREPRTLSDWSGVVSISIGPNHPLGAVPPLVAGIHVLLATVFAREGVDGRDKLAMTRSGPTWSESGLGVMPFT